jgi:hypothetical protein
MAMLSASAAAQSHVYTNADLAQPIAQITTVTPEQLATLRENQFRLPPTRPGPVATIIDSDPTYGPFGPLHQSPPRPLAPFNNLPAFGVPLFPYGHAPYGGPWFGGGRLGRPSMPVGRPQAPQGVRKRR